MIRLGQVDGIPAVSTDGPVGAGITFRVGYADEVLARSGITHLIEHLALHRLGVTDYHFNGTTAPYFTSFFTNGSPESAGTFLERVCASLQDLPVDRLEMEKDILRTEADSRGRSVSDRLQVWRYGATGPGLSGYPQWGLHALGPFDLNSWVSRYFTRENAVLWFSGMEAPAGLSLGLPSGRRQPVPACAEALPVVPAFFPELPQQLGYHALVRRSTSARLFGVLLQREMFRRLRQDGGYSYTLATDYDILDSGRAAIYAIADVAEDRQAAALGEFVDVLARFQWGTLDAAELAEVKSMVRTGWSKPESEAAALPSAACDLLLGREVAQREQLEAELEAVTAQDVKDAAREAAASALLLTPRGLDAEWAGFSPAPAWSDAAVAGQPVLAINNPDRKLVLSADGVSEVTEAGTATVALADCQAMLVWPDGGRLLVGGDGISCRVEPTLYQLPPGAVAQLDQRVPPERVVRMPVRSADSVPVPPAAPPETAKPTTPRRVATARPARRGLAIAGIWILALLLLVSVPVAVVASTTPNPPGEEAGALVGTGILWFFVALCGWGVVRLVLLLRRR